MAFAFFHFYWFYNSEHKISCTRLSEFFAEGLLHRLFGVCKDGELDEAVTNLLDHYRLYIIPNMCPDGSVLGHLRTNSVGANLNREWANAPTNDGYEAPTMERSPEVYAVLSKMDAIGCDFFLDVHGDEELPFVFFSGAEKTPVWGERIMHLHGYFIESYVVSFSLGLPIFVVLRTFLTH